MLTASLWCLMSLSIVMSIAKKAKNEDNPLISSSEINGK